MGTFYVIGRTNKRAGHRFDPVTVHQNEVGLVFHNEIRKAEHGLGKDHILGVAGSLVEKLMYGYCGGLWACRRAVCCRICYFGQMLHLKFGQAVAVHHMHACDEERDFKSV